MHIPKLSDAALLSHTTPEIVARGQSYAESGAVEAIIQRGNLLIATVAGSQYEPYRVEVAVDSSGIIGATCTCPYDWGGWCKHIVAVLLTCRATPEVIEQRPPLAELLNPLSRDQLQELLLTLARRMPAVLESLEHELLLLQATSAEAQAAPAAPDQRRTAVDTRSYRRQAEAIVGAVRGMRSGMEIYNYTSTAVDQRYELIAQAHTFTENGDGDNALRILDAITEPYVNHWFELDGSSGATGDLFTEVGMVWAEALLTADLTREEREDWQGKLEYWQTEVAEYGIESEFEPAIGAARQGWDDPEIVAVLMGDPTDRADQADPRDYTAQQITTARLNVLERQERADEFLNLARAANELPRYATMLVRVGRVPEAVETGLTHLTHAAQALTLATTLHDCRSG
ncbi:MAG: SWIM zinc finger domain-containing protein [Chloroflexaceae bacterium]